ncbi:MAG: cysteine synthase A [Rhodospirillaceae bacterium]|nr:cysteine synthase A [Rhodospirillaceae bacterium]
MNHLAPQGKLARPPQARGFANDVCGAIGNTPLIKLRRASELTSCTILGKAEFLNPGGSIKDRTALYIVDDAERRGALRPGGVIVEGTAGNTGIGLTIVARARGYRTVIVIPANQSQEKKEALRLLGAELREVPPVPAAHPDHYVKVSQRLAEELAKTEVNGAVWANQFDNTANRDGHERITAPEIWDQLDGRLDAFVASVGTGGTLAGISAGLKSRRPNIVTALADPEGAALYHYYKYGSLKAEGSSITEGIGQGRITANLDGAKIDEAFRIPDAEALPVIFNLLRDEGLCVGGSTGINVAAAIRLAHQLGTGKTIVTVLADSGTRYQSKLFNSDFLRSKDLPVPPWLLGN